LIFGCKFFVFSFEAGLAGKKTGSILSDKLLTGDFTSEILAATSALKRAPPAVHGYLCCSDSM